MLLIINKHAAKARRVWPTIKLRLDTAGIDYKVYETKSPGDATTQTRLALKSGIENVAVVGGDGTLSEVAEGFFEFNDDLDVLPKAINSEATLAVFPAGTGDDFARGLRGKRAALPDWIEMFVSSAHRARRIDLLYGRCNSFEKPFICLNAAT